MAYVMVSCAICGRSIPLLDSRDVEQVCTSCVGWIMRYDSLLKWGNSGGIIPACRLDHADRKAVKWYVDLGSESHYGVYRQEIEELESRETMLVYDGDLSKYWER